MCQVNAVGHGSATDVITRRIKSRSRSRAAASSGHSYRYHPPPLPPHSRPFPPSCNHTVPLWRTRSGPGGDLTVGQFSSGGLGKAAWRCQQECENVICDPSAELRPGSHSLPAGKIQACSLRGRVFWLRLPPSSLPSLPPHPPTLFITSVRMSENSGFLEFTHTP